MRPCAEHRKLTIAKHPQSDDIHAVAKESCRAHNEVQSLGLYESVGQKWNKVSQGL